MFRSTLETSTPLPICMGFVPPLVAEGCEA